MDAHAAMAAVASLHDNHDEGDGHGGGDGGDRRMTGGAAAAADPLMVEAAACQMDVVRAMQAVDEGAGGGELAAGGISELWPVSGGRALCAGAFVVVLVQEQGTVCWGRVVSTAPTPHRPPKRICWSRGAAVEHL